MAITGFSKRFSREIDALQYFSLIGHDIKKDPKLAQITDNERAIVREDVQCPSCAALNATIVSGAKGHRNITLRQPHFRFIDIHGNESHHEFCDLKTIKPFKDKTSNYQSFTFSQSNSHITRVIGDLISKALTNRIIKTSDIIEFRHWHFNIKKNNIVHLDFTADKIFTYQVYRLRKDLDIQSALSPVISGDSVINKLALDMVIANDQSTLKKITNQTDFNFRRRDIEKLRNHIGKPIFDVRKLVNEYFSVITLGNAMLDSFRAPLHGIKDTSILQAFCGLLLYINKWNIEESINMCNEIIHCKKCDNNELGNIIGLNPFYKFELYSALLNINEVAPELPTQRQLDESMIKTVEIILNTEKSVTPPVR